MGTESDSKRGGVPVPVQMWAGGEPSRGADAKGARDSRGSLRCRESIVSVRLSSASRRFFRSTFRPHAQSARCSPGRRSEKGALLRVYAAFTEFQLRYAHALHELGGQAMRDQADPIQSNKAICSRCRASEVQATGALCFAPMVRRTLGCRLGTKCSSVISSFRPLRRTSILVVGSEEWHGAKPDAGIQANSENRRPCSSSHTRKRAHLSVFVSPNDVHAVKVVDRRERWAHRTRHADLCLDICNDSTTGRSGILV